MTGRGRRPYALSIATTALFVEILIVGLQVEAWIALALLSAFGAEWVDLAELKDFASLLTVAVLALAYVLGIVADRLADTIIDRFERTRPGRRIKARFSKRRGTVKDSAISKMRMRVMHESEGMIRFLDYQRSRWRIARATGLNLALTGPLAALYLAVGTDADELWLLAPLLSTAVLLPVTYFAAVRIQDAWVGRLLDAYEIVMRRAREVKLPTRTGRDVVAAICHRGSGDGVELLLVRTKGGTHWTFPKGHVESAEDAREAAAREAREEAGVEGEVARAPLTRYRYPSTRVDEGESVVSAYLLAVEREGRPSRRERWRNPTWVHPDAAVGLLGDSREPRYAEEHERVVREAVAALTRSPS